MSKQESPDVRGKQHKRKSWRLRKEQITPRKTEYNYFFKKITNLRKERFYSHQTRIGCYKIKNMIIGK